MKTTIRPPPDVVHRRHPRILEKPSQAVNLAQCRGICIGRDGSRRFRLPCPDLTKSGFILKVQEIGAIQKPVDEKCIIRRGWRNWRPVRCLATLSSIRLWALGKGENEIGELLAIL